MNSSSGEPHCPGDDPASNGRLDSWKEIAAYLRRSVRSAKRWEKEQQLPVHRHHHDKRDSVYAYSAELDTWWNNRRARLTDQNGADDADSPAETGTLDCSSGLEEPEREEVVASPPSHALGRSPLIGIGFGLAIVLVGVVAWLSRNGSGASTASPRPLPFKERDWVLVTCFENRTGQPLLDGTLEYALGRELSNSRYVNVVPRERIGDALRLMRKPLDTRVDAAIGREICLRDGNIRALITGRIERLGSKYLLGIELVDPNQGASISSVAEKAASKEQLLSATRRISDQVRAMLGENPPSTRQSESDLPKVTTHSLGALHLYSQADALIAQGKNPPAEELLRQAVTEDPDFASAHVHLAWAIHNQNRPKQDFLSEAETAYQLSAKTTERERYFIRGSYYQMRGQQEKAIAAYQALLALYPDHFWGVGNLWGLYATRGRYQDAVELTVRRADLRPKDFEANSNAAFLLTPLDRVRSQVYIRRARELISPTIIQEFPEDVAYLEQETAAENWLDGNLTHALQVADGLAAKIESLSGRARRAFAEEAFIVYLTLGRLEAAARCVQKIPDPHLRHELLSRMAFIRDDRPAIRQHLEALEGATQLRPIRVNLLARAGLLSQAARFLARLEAQEHDIYEGGVLQISRGELSVARGEADRGIAQLEEGTRRVAERGHSLFFLGSESLATAFKKKGDLAQAVRVLEGVSEKRSWAAFQHSGFLWLRSRFQLGRLYGETGREEEARTIEEELRRLLALADPDHPIRRELDRPNVFGAPPRSITSVARGVVPRAPR